MTLSKCVSYVFTIMWRRAVVKGLECNFTRFCLVVVWFVVLRQEQWLGFCEFPIRCLKMGADSVEFD